MRHHPARCDRRETTDQQRVGGTAGENLHLCGFSFVLVRAGGSSLRCALSGDVSHSGRPCRRTAETNTPSSEQETLGGTGCTADVEASVSGRTGVVRAPSSRR
jgi:hypothetical protein